MIATTAAVRPTGRTARGPWIDYFLSMSPFFMSPLSPSFFFDFLAFFGFISPTFSSLGRPPRGQWSFWRRPQNDCRRPAS